MVRRISCRSAPHRGDDLTPEQIAENNAAVHRAWKLHYDECRHSLANAFYQGWDLHPGQLPTRYAAVFTFFLEGLESAGERLSNFIEKAGRATLVGDIFDDAATGQGLLNFLPACDQLRSNHRRRSDASHTYNARRTPLGFVCEDIREPSDVIVDWVSSSCRLSPYYVLDWPIGRPSAAVYRVLLSTLVPVVRVSASRELRREVYPYPLQSYRDVLCKAWSKPASRGRRCLRGQICRNQVRRCGRCVDHAIDGALDLLVRHIAIGRSIRTRTSLVVFINLFLYFAIVERSGEIKVCVRVLAVTGVRMGKPEQRSGCLKRRGIDRQRCGIKFERADSFVFTTAKDPLVDSLSTID